MKSMCLACKMSRGSSQVVYVSWYNSSVGIGGQTSNRCNSWDVLDSISESISVSKVSITVSFTLSNVVTIWPSSVSSISDMGDSGDSDVLEDWSSFGSKMGSGGGSNSWGISWYNSSVSIGGESSNRGDWGSSWDENISIGISFTLANVVSIWPSTVSSISVSPM